MYTTHFNLKEIPFSIAPDPAYLYMSPRHQEALGHLLYGTGQYGGFVQLTGEVGTGKTTIIRTLLTQQLVAVDAAMIHNPRQSEQEFVQSICDELHVPYVREGMTLKTLVDALNVFLLKQHEKGRRTVLIIDEAQQLAPEVLEQVRLLTNLETNKEKLLRIMLVGQPELAELLARNDLRQLAQRITARYHLTPLNAAETAEYISHRLKVAGGNPNLFLPAAIKTIFRHSGGVPRLINVLCDRALLGAYSQTQPHVSAEIVDAAAAEVLGVPVKQRKQVAASFSLPKLPQLSANTVRWLEVGLAVAAVLLAAVLVLRYWHPIPKAKNLPTATSATASTADAALALESSPLPALPSPALPTLAKLADPNAASLRKLQATPEPAAVADGMTGIARAASAPLNQQMLKLGRLWQPNFKASRSEPTCRSLHRNRLECLKGSAEWRELAAMNAPAILTLSFGKNDVRHVLLLQLSKDTATLLGPKGKQQIATKALDPVWSGEYLVLWRRETDEVLIGPETRGEPVQWLRKRLAQKLGREVGNADNPRWDSELKTALQRFQSSSGIRPDGIAGARTLMALGQPGPQLRGGR